MRCHTRHRILALYPTARGFGFALFDSRERLIDWGTHSVRTPDKNGPTLRAIERLIERTQPTTIACEDTRSIDSRRHARIRVLLHEVYARGTLKKLSVFRFTRSTIRNYFGIRTKRELAEMIALAYPALAPRLPPTRKAWMSEDARQSLFDAVALGVVCLAALEGPSKRSPIR